MCVYVSKQDSSSLGGCLGCLVMLKMLPENVAPRGGAGAGGRRWTKALEIEVIGCERSELLQSSIDSCSSE